MPPSAQRNGKKLPLGEQRRTMSKVELWEQKQKKKMTKITKNSKKSKEIDVKILRQQFGIMNKKKLVAAD